MKAFGRLHNDEADVTVSAVFEFPGKVTATMLLTAEAHIEPGKDLKSLNHVDYIGTKGSIVIRDFINNPKQIEVNGKIVDTSTDISKDTRYNWGNSSGLRYQASDQLIRL